MQCLKILEMIAEARRVPREQALSKVYARLRQDLDQIFDVNVMLRPATNLNNATKYGDIWKFNELQWQSGEGSEVSRRPISMSQMGDFSLGGELIFASLEERRCMKRIR